MAQGKKPAKKPAAVKPVVAPPVQGVEVTNTQDVEKLARDAERATKAAIKKTGMVPIWIDPVFNKEGEVVTYRLNGVAYHIKTKQTVMVPRALADVILDQARRKKRSARIVSEYVASTNSPGYQMGDLR